MLAFAMAAALSAAWFLVHLVMGGKQIARPLLANTSLDPIVRDTQYLCWHLTTAGIGVQAVLSALATGLNTPAYAVAGTLLAASFAATGIAIPPAVGQRFKAMPQGWLFVPVAALGVIGLL